MSKKVAVRVPDDVQGLRDILLNTPDPRRVPVDLTELATPCRVWVREWTMGDRMDFEGRIFRLRQKGDYDPRTYRARVVIDVTVSESGHPVFTLEHLGMLTDRVQRYYEPILDAHARLNELDAVDRKDLEKKSEGKGTDSP